MVTWVKINGRNLVDLVISIALILLVSFLYRRWETLLLLTLKPNDGFIIIFISDQLTLHTTV